MFLNPQEILEHMPYTSTSVVGDFGCGCGDYARRIGEDLSEGRVYAFDVRSEHLDATTKGCAEQGVSNVFPVQADLNSHIPLKDGLLDAALLSNTLHALKEREQFLTELRRVLKPRGSVLFVDWVHSFKSAGPPTAQVIYPEVALALFTEHGFTLGRMLPAGSHHYAFIARKV